MAAHDPRSFARTNPAPQVSEHPPALLVFDVLYYNRLTLEHLPESTTPSLITLAQSTQIDAVSTASFVRTHHLFLSKCRQVTLFTPDASCPHTRSSNYPFISSPRPPQSRSKLAGYSCTSTPTRTSTWRCQYATRISGKARWTCCVINRRDRYGRMSGCEQLKNTTGFRWG